MGNDSTSNETILFFTLIRMRYGYRSLVRWNEIRLNDLRHKQMYQFIKYFSRDKNDIDWGKVEIMVERDQKKKRQHRSRVWPLVMIKQRELVHSVRSKHIQIWKSMGSGDGAWASGASPTSSVSPRLVVTTAAAEAWPAAVSGSSEKESRRIALKEADVSGGSCLSPDSSRTGDCSGVMDKSDGSPNLTPKTVG